MSILKTHLCDGGVLPADWTGSLASPGASVQQTAGSAKRGAGGLDAQFSGGPNYYAYAYDTLNYALGNGNSVFLGFWLQPVSGAAANAQEILVRLRTPAGSTIASFRTRRYLGVEGCTLRVVATLDSGSTIATEEFSASFGIWCFVEMEVHCSSAPGAANGYAQFRVNGGDWYFTGLLDNDIRAVTITDWRVGVESQNSTGNARCYFDQIRLASTLAEVADPAGTVAAAMYYTRMRNRR